MQSVKSTDKGRYMAENKRIITETAEHLYFDKGEIRPHDGYGEEEYTGIPAPIKGKKDPPGGFAKFASLDSYYEDKSYLENGNLQGKAYQESGTYKEEVPLALDFCGYEHCVPRHSFGPLARSIYIVHAVIRGKGTLWYHKQRYEITAGNLFLLPPGEVTTYMADDRDPWYYCWIAFHGKVAPRCISEIGFTTDNPVVAIRNTQGIENKILSLLPYFGNSMEERLMRGSLLHAILAEMIRESVAHVDVRLVDEQVSYAEYAANYIRVHYHEKIRIADLAQHIGISRSYLVSIMKKALGMSPKEYLTMIRMSHAGHYLSHTEDSIREIAVECGYSDPLAFTKAFKLYFGVNPSEYRVIHRDNRVPEDQTGVDMDELIQRKD